MENNKYNQSYIWDHFQTTGVSSFDQNRGRLEFLSKKFFGGEKVLNIGIGNGTFERIALGKGIDIWSLDPSSDAVKKISESLNLGEKAKPGFSQNIPFPNESFDAIVMSEVLEHLEPDVFKETLLEVYRVLKPGGLFLGTVPANERLEDSLVVCPKCGDKFHRWGHKLSFSVNVLNDELYQVFSLTEVYEKFFIEWDSVTFFKKIQGIIKKILSWCRVGTYGTSRNIVFSAKK